MARPDTREPLAHDDALILDGATHWHTIDQQICLSNAYAAFARGWVSLDAQIDGGCGATGPEHIQTVRVALRPTPVGRGTGYTAATCNRACHDGKRRWLTLDRPGT